MKNRIIKFYKKLVYRLTPEFIYGKDRTQNKSVFIFLEHGLYPKDITEYLKKVHPRKWYDDEAEALFFAIWDYLTKVRKLDVSFKVEPFYGDEKVIRINNECCGIGWYHEDAKDLLSGYEYYKRAVERIYD